MKIAILGAGFTGLSAALKLSGQGHKVTVFEKESQVGGLASAFKLPSWDWALEKSYHHFFTSDRAVFNLAHKVDQKIITLRPKTDVLIDGKIIPLDSPASLLSFPYLSFFQKLRSGLALGYLKFLAQYKSLENYQALPWIRKMMGQKVADLIWEPLFLGKFGPHKETISLTWFWARIKKRTTKLAYPEEGFQSFAEKLAEKIKNLGGQILLNSEVTLIKSNSKNSSVILSVTKNPSLASLSRRSGRMRESNDNHKALTFDKVIVTLPSPIFTKITPQLPKTYIQKISQIPHLSALNLILILKKPFLKNTYWLNITNSDFPFLSLVEHTNFMPAKHYGGQHILYIGSYLPENHPHLKMSAEELLAVYDPFLKKINPTLNFELCTLHLFSQPHAQPVVTTQYPKLIPEFKTPLENIYLANLDMVYPWDRGVNYAVELGEKVAEIINNEN